MNGQTNRLNFMQHFNYYYKLIKHYYYMVFMLCRNTQGIDTGASIADPRAHQNLTGKNDRERAKREKKRKIEKAGKSTAKSPE